MVRSQGRPSYSSSSSAGYLFLFLERAVGVSRALAAGSAQLISAAMASLVRSGNSETLYAETGRELSYGMTSWYALSQIFPAASSTVQFRLLVGLVPP
jgi:hypothetical protein